MFSASLMQIIYLLQYKIVNLKWNIFLRKSISPKDDPEELPERGNSEVAKGGIAGYAVCGEVPMDESMGVAEAVEVANEAIIFRRPARVVVVEAVGRGDVAGAHQHLSMTNLHLTEKEACAQAVSCYRLPRSYSPGHCSRHEVQIVPTRIKFGGVRRTVHLQCVKYDGKLFSTAQFSRDHRHHWLDIRLKRLLQVRYVGTSRQEKLVHIPVRYPLSAPPEAAQESIQCGVLDVHVVGVQVGEVDECDQVCI